MPHPPLRPRNRSSISRAQRSRKDPVDIARAFTQHWNDHDGAAVASLFALNGTYVDPILPGPLSGEGIAM